MGDNVHMPHAASDTVVSLLTRALVRIRGERGLTSAPAIDGTTDLVDAGLVDSQRLLEMILEVEEICGRTFDPTLIDLEGGITISRLADAFS